MPEHGTHIVFNGIPARHPDLSSCGHQEGLEGIACTRLSLGAEGFRRRQQRRGHQLFQGSSICKKILGNVEGQTRCYSTKKIRYGGVEICGRSNLQELRTTHPQRSCRDVVEAKLHHTTTA